MGPRYQADLFMIPMTHMRWAAFSIGPQMVTYGLTAACSSVFPIPPTNEAARNR